VKQHGLLQDGQVHSSGDPITDSLIVSVKRSGNDTCKVNTLLAICIRMINRNSPDEIFPFARQAKKISEDLLSSGVPASARWGINKNLGRTLAIMGILHSRTGDYVTSFARLHEALQVYEKIGFRRGIANVYSNLGAISLEKGDPVKALEYQLQGLKIREALTDSGDISNSYYNLSEIYQAAGRYALAEKNAFTALKIRELTGDVQGMSQSYIGLGNLNFQQYKNKQARLYYMKALEVNKKIGNVAAEGAVLKNLGNIFHDDLQLDSAIQYYERSQQIYAKLNDGIQQARTSVNIARAYFLKKNYRKAREILIKAADSLMKYKKWTPLGDTYDHLAQIDSALGNFRSAYTFMRMNRNLAWDNLSKKSSTQINELQGKYDTEKSDEENRRLTDQNRIQGLQIYRSRLLLMALGIIFIFSVIIFILLLQGKKFRGEKNAIQLEQRLLRSQMNPHFIFNALQAIQYYILNHNEKQSVHYLDSFASLTRDVLESSRVEVISLHKELNLLNNYLELQKLRFGDRFDYKIHVSRDVNPNSILLPPMLSQPFIENAIEHGLSDVESEGRVDVYFAIENSALLMTIIDNGSGIQENGQHKSRASLAIEITRERIALLNKKNKRESSFKIEDANPSRTHRKGVKVSFNIPLPVSV
jgi:tetratricopeptide (TPR) repeat protein